MASSFVVLTSYPVSVCWFGRMWEWLSQGGQGRGWLGEQASLQQNTGKSLGAKSEGQDFSHTQSNHLVSQGCWAEPHKLWDLIEQSDSFSVLEAESPRSCFLLAATSRPWGSVACICLTLVYDFLITLLTSLCMPVSAWHCPPCVSSLLLLWRQQS